MAESNLIYTVLNLLAFQSDPVWLSVALYICGLLQVAFIGSLVFWPLKERLAKVKSEPPKEPAPSDPVADDQQKADAEQKPEESVAAACKTNFCSNLLQTLKKSKKNKEKKKKR